MTHLTGEDFPPGCLGSAANGELAYGKRLYHVILARNNETGFHKCMYCDSLFKEGEYKESEKLQMAKLQRELEQ